MWLAWSAWLMIGGIFVFEDIKGGSGWLTILLTSPLWLMFIVWPFLYAWLRSMRNTDYVEIDDDIKTPTLTCRMVQKDAIRYIDKEDLQRIFNVQATAQPVRLEGGPEEFFKIEDVRIHAKDNKAFAEWLAVVDSLAYPATYY